MEKSSNKLVYLSVAQDKDLRQKIYDFIVAEALTGDENTMQFWEHKLNYCGFY